ncbi:hypothetical protein N8Z33_00880 [Flavobacteriaceae bacterium]|nr:hypothetical protein [Flavobacteriaceae bacterium]
MENTTHTKKILINSKFKKILAKEFNTTRQTVHTALTYFNNSRLAEKIRTRAKEFLVAEAEKIES